MVEDITEQKKAQAALIQAEKLTLAGKLAASLSHEINNPLQSIIGCLGLAEETLAEGGDANRYLQVARDELRRTARIVNQLRKLHRPSRPEKRLPINVNGLLEQVLLLSARQCESHGVEVVWEPTEDLPLLLAPDQMQQVFLNLVLNAIDAMPVGGALQVGATRTNQPAGVRVVFSDNGVGIAADVLPRIFDPYYSTKAEGMGLGLYLSQNIVQQHGGDIEVRSEVEEGTTFTVWLPA
jgi:signal transduction histidine kinase